MVSPGWAAFVLALLGAAFGIVGAWFVVQFRVNKLEESRQLDRDEALAARKSDREEAARQVAALTTAIANLDRAIRDSVASVGREIKGLLFNASDAGRPFYMRADDCRSAHRECRDELVERLDLLEDKSHTHGGT